MTGPYAASELREFSNARPAARDDWEATVAFVEARRRAISQQLDSDSGRSDLGQYLTPDPIAGLMASLLDCGDRESIRLLEPGAGVGSLIVAAVRQACRSPRPPRELHVTAYELDSRLLDELHATLKTCSESAARARVSFTYEVLNDDFIAAGTRALRDESFGIFGSELNRFDWVITNPPYRKLNTDSEHRRMLSAVGIETTNLYSAFIALGVQMLNPMGEMVAITPRSFCLAVVLSAGGQNTVIKKVVEEFVPQFVQKPHVLYIGDAASKQGVFDEEGLRALGLEFDRHGQMPDVIVHDGKRDWLILVEAVTSHGPMNPKRVITTMASGTSARTNIRRVCGHDGSRVRRFPDRVRESAVACYSFTACRVRNPRRGERKSL